MVLYVLAMAFTLVYGGEHYVFDVVVGWCYAIAVVAGAAALERLRARGGLANQQGWQPALVTATADGGERLDGNGPAGQP
jgi:membrane-associated phospholipid phosphatase